MSVLLISSDCNKDNNAIFIKYFRASAKPSDVAIEDDEVFVTPSESNRKEDKNTADQQVNRLNFIKLSFILI